MAWPPPTAPATDDIPLEQGQLEIGVGGSAPTAVIEGRPAVYWAGPPRMVYNLGLPFFNEAAFNLGYGVSDHLALRVRTGRSAWGANRGLEANWTLSQNIVLIGGVSGGCYEDTASVRVQPDTGDTGPEWETFDYSYCNAAATVGVGLNRPLSPRWTATMRVQTSAGRVFRVEGVERERQGLWVEGGPGIVWASGPMLVGLKMGVRYGTPGTGAVSLLLVPTLGATVRF